MTLRLENTLKKPWPWQHRKPERAARYMDCFARITKENYSGLPQSMAWPGASSTGITNSQGGIMVRISNEYLDAILKKQIPLIASVGRIKGQMTRGGIRKWQSHGLTVVVDDRHFLMVATYYKKLVAASLHDRCMFEWGDWFNLVEWYSMEIEQIEQAAYLERCRETMNGLMKKGEN
jgi:hypothetical protein